MGIPPLVGPVTIKMVVDQAASNLKHRHYWSVLCEQMHFPLSYLSPSFLIRIIMILLRFFCSQVGLLPAK